MVDYAVGHQQIYSNVYYVNSQTACLASFNPPSAAADIPAMLTRLPKQLPGIEEILLELGRPPADQVAKALQVSPSTVKRWIRSGRIPRPAHLALYWLTHHGRADIELDMHNELIITRGLARALQREHSDLTHLVRHLMAIGQFGSANAPIARPERLSV